MQVSPGEQEIQQKKESQPEAMYATVRRSAKSVRDNIRAMEAHDGYATLNQQGLDDATNDRNATLTRSVGVCRVNYSDNNKTNLLVLPSVDIFQHINEFVHYILGYLV